MKGYLITTGTVTYALKGRDILRKKGFKASVDRTSTNENNSQQLDVQYSKSVNRTTRYRDPRWCW